MIDYVNIIAFIVVICAAVKLVGRILELEEAAMERDYEIRILQRNAMYNERTIERLRAAAVAAVAAVEADPGEELEEGEIVEPVRDRRRR